MLLRHLVLGTSLGELGRNIQETDATNNYHPELVKYWLAQDPPIRLVDTDGDGTPNGYAYCMAFVMWCIRTTCRRYDRPNPLEPMVREAYVQDLYMLAKNSGWIIPADRADTGHLVLYRFGRNPTRWNHVGIVFHNDHPNFRAVEANTSPPNDLPNQSGEAEREGGGIWAKPRTYDPDRVCFVAWDGNIEVENP